jgi:hypothetical protein
MARGRPGPAPQTAKREQYAELIARDFVRGGVPDCGSQSPDRETVATRAHSHQQQRREAALSTRDHCAEGGDPAPVPVRGRAGPVPGFVRSPDRRQETTVAML